MDLLEQPVLTGLPDVAAPVFALALQLRGQKDPGAFDTLRHRIEDALATFERRALRASIEAEDVELARFALVAFIDEIVLRSNWPIRDAWASRPLQMQYFDEVNAGVVFYEKLEQLRGRSQRAKVDVLEIYVTVIGLGFRGRHADTEGASKVRALLRSVTDEIEAARSVRGSRQLSPSWSASALAPQSVRELPPWVAAAVAAAALLLVYLVLSWALDGQLAELTAKG